MTAERRVNCCTVVLIQMLYCCYFIPREEKQIKSGRTKYTLASTPFRSLINIQFHATRRVRVGFPGASAASNGNVNRDGNVYTQISTEHEHLMDHSQRSDEGLEFLAGDPDCWGRTRFLQPPFFVLILPVWASGSQSGPGSSLHCRPVGKWNIGGVRRYLKCLLRAASVQVTCHVPLHCSPCLRWCEGERLVTRVASQRRMGQFISHSSCWSCIRVSLVMSARLASWRGLQSCHRTRWGGMSAYLTG